MEQKINSNRGITLIALVITIIVLLILAAVTIATLTGENGILTKATKAKLDTEIAEEKEQIRLAYTAALATTNGQTVSKDNFMEELQKLNPNIELSGGEDNSFTVTVNGRIYTVGSDGTVEDPSEAVKITFDSNGGDGNMTSMTVGKGKKVKLISNSFTKANSGFGKWTTEQDESGKEYLNNAEITVNEDTTLYAQWAYYGTAIQNQYDKIYTTYDSKNDIPLMSDYDRTTENTAQTGNYCRLFTLRKLTSQNQKSLISLSDGNNPAKVKYGENEYNFIEETNNNWILIVFSASNATSKANVDNFHLKFSDQQEKTIREAVNNDYIEPLVLAQGLLQKNFNEQWTNFINILDGKSTGNGAYPRGALALKVKSKESLTSIKFNATNGENDWGNGDGFLVYKLNDFELSTEPF